MVSDTCISKDGKLNRHSTEINTGTCKNAHSILTHLSSEIARPQERRTDARVKICVRHRHTMHLCLLQTKGNTLTEYVQLLLYLCHVRARFGTLYKLTLVQLVFIVNTTPNQCVNICCTIKKKKGYTLWSTRIGLAN